VLALTRTGYVEASHGTNGFTYFVFRSFAGILTDPNFWNTRVRAPACSNPPATKTLSLETLDRAKWVMAGVSPAENRHANEEGVCIARALNARSGSNGAFALA
jgi:hypothetical protein